MGDIKKKSIFLKISVLLSTRFQLKRNEVNIPVKEHEWQSKEDPFRIADYASEKKGVTKMKFSKKIILTLPLKFFLLTSLYWTGCSSRVDNPGYQPGKFSESSLSSQQICASYSPTLGPYTKYEFNPILKPTSHGWESMNVFNPTVIVKDGKFYMFYRAEDKDITKFKYYRSEIGLAISNDGIHWERYQDSPIIPATESYELPGGCEDPRLFKHQDTYYLWYTGYHELDGGELTVDQCMAISKDLIHWDKQGPRGYKNDTILVNPYSEAVQLNGKFMLYNEQHIAYSEDLIHWDYKPLDIKKQIPGFLELCSAVTEIPGEEDKIILLAAVKPEGSIRDLIDEIAICKRGYAKSQMEKANHYVIVEIIISRKDPEKILGISEPILYPTESYEFEGLLGPGNPFPVVFVNSGLLLHENKWLLYYGGADHVICLATAELSERTKEKD